MDLNTLDSQGPSERN